MLAPSAPPKKRTECDCGVGRGGSGERGGEEDGGGCREDEGGREEDDEMMEDARMKAAEDTEAAGHMLVIVEKNVRKFLKKRRSEHFLPFNKKRGLNLNKFKFHNYSQNNNFIK